MGDEGKKAEVSERRRARPALDELATSLHASFIARWGRHDPAGLEREIAERRAEAAKRRPNVA